MYAGSLHVHLAKMLGRYVTCFNEIGIRTSIALCSNLAWLQQHMHQEKTWHEPRMIKRNHRWLEHFSNFIETSWLLICVVGTMRFVWQKRLVVISASSLVQKKSESPSSNTKAIGFRRCFELLEILFSSQQFAQEAWNGSGGDSLSFFRCNLSRTPRIGGVVKDITSALL